MKIVDDERTGMVSIGTALGAGHIVAMTDEQWAARDSEIEHKLQRQRDFELSAARRAREQQVIHSGFPRRAVEFARCADETKSAIARVKNWNTDDDTILVVSGAHGCGKTVAATWWALGRKFPPMFVRASTFAASSRYDRETRTEWFSASALVLDDLGAEFLDAKGSFLVDLDELLDVFYGDRKPLLVTTNCSLDEFRDRYGARVVDRLRESGSWFSASGGSLRGGNTP